MQINASRRYTNSELFLDYKAPKSSLSDEMVINYLDRIKKGDVTAKEELVASAIYIVIGVVRGSLKNNFFDDQELVSVGTIGLLKAINNYDPAKNVAFTTYASVIIKNEILMFMRREKKGFTDISMNMPLESCSEEEYENCYEDILVSDTSFFVDDLMEKADYEVLNNLVKELPPKEQFVVRKYFGFDGEVWGQCLIAECLGCTQSYVSRLLKTSIKRLNFKMKELETLKNNNNIDQISITRNKKRRKNA